jgi:hypothetical protein
LSCGFDQIFRKTPMDDKNQEKFPIWELCIQANVHAMSNPIACVQLQWLFVRRLFLVSIRLSWQCGKRQPTTGYSFVVQT